MKKIVIILLILLEFSLSANEDNNISIEHTGKRTGLFLSLGGGMSQEQLDFLNDSKLDRSETYYALATNFKVGIFLDENLGIFYSNYTSFYSAPHINNGVNSDSIYLDALNGVGVIYYLDSLPNFYLSASAGIATFMTIGEKNADFGSTYMLACGYEFENNVNIEIVLRKFADISSNDYSYLSTETQSSQILVGYTFY